MTLIDEHLPDADPWPQRDTLLRNPRCQKGEEQWEHLQRERIAKQQGQESGNGGGDHVHWRRSSVGPRALQQLLCDGSLRCRTHQQHGQASSAMVIRAFVCQPCI
ncbi:hypothetical protein M758_1G054600 [Ceratodon purpureus]|nr:hypothetical protein M758_1G054600 [Ceratodon purpureus]